jgi:hypothetical protein
MQEMTITSLHLIVDCEVQLSTPTMTYVDECFTNYLKMEQLIRKGRGRVGADFIFYNRLLWSLGNSMPELT